MSMTDEELQAHKAKAKAEALAAHKALQDARAAEKALAESHAAAQERMREESREAREAVHKALRSRVLASRRAQHAGVPLTALAEGMGVSAPMMTFIVKGER